MVTIKLSESVLHSFLAQIEMYGNNESFKFIDEMITQCGESGYQVDPADVLLTQHIMIGQKFKRFDLKPWMLDIIPQENIIR